MSTVLWNRSSHSEISSEIVIEEDGITIMNRGDSIGNTVNWKLFNFILKEIEYWIFDKGSRSCFKIISGMDFEINVSIS